jgi:REP element-mobilizing transposase RayT
LYSPPVPENLYRTYGARDHHFLTFSCYHRQPLLSNASRCDLLLQVLERVRRRYRLVVLGYVVMPEHVHLLVTEPQRSTLSTAVQALKLGFIRRLEGAGVPGSRNIGETPGHPTFFLNSRKCTPSLLAGAVLRFQCVDRRKANREAPLYPSQSGQERARRLTRAVVLEQLSLVHVERAGSRQDQ